MPSIWIVVDDSLDDSKVACTNQEEAYRIMEQLDPVCEDTDFEPSYKTREVQLVDKAEEWEGWPTNKEGIRKRALEKLTREEQEVLGLIEPLSVKVKKGRK